MRVLSVYIADVVFVVVLDMMVGLAIRVRGGAFVRWIVGRLSTGVKPKGVIGRR